MIDVDVTATVRLVTVNVAVLAPADTGTLAGTVAAAGLLLNNVTVAPPVGAGPLKVTVAVEFDTLPITAVGLKVRDVGAGGVTVSVAVAATT